MRALALAFAVLFLAACDSGSRESGIGDLTLTVNAAGIPGNNLLIQTEATFDGDCGLDVELDGSGRELEIEIVGTAVTGAACSNVPGPYAIVIPLPDVIPNGYSIVLEKDGLVDRYTVAVTGDPDAPLALNGTGSFSRVITG